MPEEDGNQSEVSSISKIVYSSIPPVVQTPGYSPNKTDVLYQNQLADYQFTQEVLVSAYERLEEATFEEEKEVLENHIHLLTTEVEEKHKKLWVARAIYVELQNVRSQYLQTSISNEPVDYLNQKIDWLESKLKDVDKFLISSSMMTTSSAGDMSSVIETDTPDYQRDDISEEYAFLLQSPCISEPAVLQVNSLGKEKVLKWDEMSQEEEISESKDQAGYDTKPTTPKKRTSFLPIVLSPEESTIIDEDEDISSSSSYFGSDIWSRNMSKSQILPAEPEAEKEDSNKDVEEDVPQEVEIEDDVIEVDSYWQSEHHTFEYVSNYEDFVSMNPCTYHLLGLAKPGSYIKESSRIENPTLPWLPRRRESEADQIHKDAINNVQKKIHVMFDNLYDAAIKSTDFSRSEPLEIKMKRPVPTHTPHSEAHHKDIVPFDGNESQVKPHKLNLISGKTKVYEPLPLLMPDKLPLPKIDRSDPLPHNSYLYCGPVSSRMKNNEAARKKKWLEEKEKEMRLEDSGLIITNENMAPPGFWEELPPPARLVNQKTLYRDTKFSGSIYLDQLQKEAFHMGVQLKEIVKTRRERAVSQADLKSRHAACNTSFVSKSSKGKVRASIDVRENAQTEENPAPRRSIFRSKALMIKNVGSFTGAVQNQIEKKRIEGPSWATIKPIPDALEHSGLKWERIKDLVHINLQSERPLERQDAARALGKLRCADTMVLYALKQILHTDPDYQVRFEVTNTLLQLGCWENTVMQGVTFFLTKFTDNVRSLVLQGILTSKNAHFVDKRLSAFKTMVDAINECCESSCEEVAYKAAHSFGALCIGSESARNHLFKIIYSTKDHTKIVESCDVLIRRMNCRERKLIDILLHELRWCPATDGRAKVAKLFIFLGADYVVTPESKPRIFDILENRLWDDSNKEVKLEIARAIISLNFFEKVCERAEKKLGNRDDKIRAQGVLSIGALAIQNNNIIRILLEMVELDPSEFIRILVVRAFGDIGLNDQRIIRSLKEKKNQGNLLSGEAEKVLKILEKKKTL